MANLVQADDEKTGRPRAANVQPGLLTGTLCKNNGKCGFIQQDGGGEKVFVMSGAFKATGHLPPVWTRVGYEIVTDEKTGHPRAENCQVIA